MAGMTPRQGRCRRACESSREVYCLPPGVGNGLPVWVLSTYTHRLIHPKGPPMWDLGNPVVI